MANPIPPSIDAIEEDEIDLRHYWNVIYRRKWHILALAFVICLITALVVFSMQPIYRATSTLLIEPPKDNPVNLETLYGFESPGSEYFQTQVEILKSRELARKIIDKLDLGRHPTFSPDKAEDKKSWLSVILPGAEKKKTELSEQARELALIDAFMAGLNVSAIRKTHLVKINYESPDKNLAARIANLLADAYIETQFEARVQITEKSSNWLTNRLGPLKETLAKSELRLQAFREKENLVDIEGVRTLVAKELNEITVDLVEARKKRTEAENLLNQIRSSKDLINVPAILNHPVIQELNNSKAQVEKRIAELSKRYGPQHPKMLAANSEMTSIDNNISKHIQRVVASIKKAHTIAKTNEMSLARALKKAKQEIQSINRKEHKLRELQREVEANQKVYEAFLSRFQETTATQDFEPINARLTEKATPPQHPAKPKKRLILAQAFVSSTMLGVFLAFLLEFINNTVRNPEDVKLLLDIPMLGVLPKVPLRSGQSIKPLDIFQQNQYQNVAESIRTIRTGLMLSGIKGKHKITLVTSSVPGEGKTTISSSLALAFSQLGTVLLIDSDMRRPSMCKTFGLPEKSPGLSNLVARTHVAKDCIHSIVKRKLYLLPSGSIPPNPLELISSKRFHSTLQKLAEKFDFVIIDSPPVQAVSDSLILSKIAHQTVFVVRADATSQRVISDASTRLQEAKGRIAGTVLNHYEHQAGDYYGYYYGEPNYGKQT